LAMGCVMAMLLESVLVVILQLILQWGNPNEYYCCYDGAKTWLVDLTRRWLQQTQRCDESAGNVISRGVKTTDP
jgi:hypothetical protein